MQSLTVCVSEMLSSDLRVTTVWPLSWARSGLAAAVKSFQRNSSIKYEKEQGKKVCKVTAVRCAHLFLFAGIAEKQCKQVATTNQATVVSC